MGQAAGQALGEAAATAARRGGTCQEVKCVQLDELKAMASCSRCLDDEVRDLYNTKKVADKGNPWSEEVLIDATADFYGTKTTAPQPAPGHRSSAAPRSTTEPGRSKSGWFSSWFCGSSARLSTSKGCCDPSAVIVQRLIAAEARAALENGCQDRRGCRAPQPKGSNEPGSPRSPGSSSSKRKGKTAFGLSSAGDEGVTGKVILVTGCTAGVGRHLTLQLARLRPRKLLLLCRDTKKGEAMKVALQAKGVDSTVFRCDLSQPRDVFQVASRIRALGEPLHVLVSNAGIWEVSSPKAPVLQEDNLELHFMTNYLSMVLLCSELKPLLESSGSSRIVITGSSAGLSVLRGEIDFENLQGAKLQTVTIPNDVLYGQTKLLQQMWAKKFSTLLPKNCALLVFDPGLVESNLTIYAWAREVLGLLLYRFFFRSKRTLASAAGLGVWCCDNPAAEGIRGMYLDGGVTEGSDDDLHELCELGYYPSVDRAAPSIMDEMQVERLWQFTEGVCQTLRAKYGVP
mmetsp:Transcript_20489/g.47747  ORF Transcript_20489/g.47747 Transcript_20489/m.47747 type:complete len:514 (+) Transcript_20489:80-1621(+)